MISKFERLLDSNQSQNSSYLTEAGQIEQGAKRCRGSGLHRPHDATAVVIKIMEKALDVDSRRQLK
jgi:hypothetical protein